MDRQVQILHQQLQVVSEIVSEFGFAHNYIYEMNVLAASSDNVYVELMLAYAPTAQTLRRYAVEAAEPPAERAVLAERHLTGNLGTAAAALAPDLGVIFVA